MGGRVSGLQGSEWKRETKKEGKIVTEIESVQSNVENVASSTQGSLVSRRAQLLQTQISCRFP